MFSGKITNVKAIKVAQLECEQAKTGVTVILCENDGAVVSVDVRGAAPGTRETDLCTPENTVQKANAIVLSGGSAYGLDTASGVMKYLEENKKGVKIGNQIIPIVPAAVIFDLLVGDGNIRPNAEMGYKACQNASKDVKQGAFGAGCGATVGKIIPDVTPQQSGVGTASITLPNGVTIGAIVVVNACGDIYHPKTGELLAGGKDSTGKIVPFEKQLLDSVKINSVSGMNTTIAVVATDAKCNKTQVKRMCVSAHDGYARAIRPVHTQMDGDTIFGLATCEVEAEISDFQLQALSAEVVSLAIANVFL